jgi:valyl-tRNA synthetase
MDVVLSATMRLLHPFMPHLTEEIWSLLALGNDSDSVCAPGRKDRVRRGAGTVAERRRARYKHLRNRSSRS